MKAIILARVSTEEQREAGNSLPAQISRLENYCQRKDFDILKSFSFDESAYKDKRIEFDEILKEIKSTKEKIAVCFDKVDRFSRNVFDQRVAQLYDLAMEDKIELHFANDNLVINSSISATEKFQFNMSLGLAKYYSDAISDNTKRVLDQKLRNGEIVGPAPFGYLNTEDNNEKKTVILDPDNAPVVKRIFEMYATGNYSIKTIRDEINKLGVKGKRGKPLTHSVIHRFLRNKFYYGIQVRKGQGYPHKYEPIIARDLFDKVQIAINSTNKKHAKRAIKPFALRGLIKCSNCGCSISPEIKKGKYIYYSCTNYKGKCKKIWVREEDLLKPILEMLKDLQVPKDRVEKTVADLKDLNESKNIYHSEQIKRLQEEYQATQGKLDRLMDLLVDGSITKDDYDRKLKQYKERQYQIGQELDSHTEADENYHITASTVFSLANRALEIFESSKPAEKQEFLKYILQNCQLEGKKLVYTLKAPYSTMLLASKNVNWLPVRDVFRTFCVENPNYFIKINELTSLLKSSSADSLIISADITKPLIS